eukprot:CAMPEP_0170464612 /NCGR_PEP_ID=MMETSP0123-20130129/9266_1 /TAXON_ID=182087 /ORGANISM="Favella ehrenbergii, Strain Fehren 1" /LENGTH=41 /DNA_ID= /DNA_START= /DNA_END= /DNA_ORIENTATION=
MEPFLPTEELHMLNMLSPAVLSVLCSELARLKRLAKPKSVW